MCGNCNSSSWTGDHPNHNSNCWGNKNNKDVLFNLDLTKIEKNELELLRKEVMLYREIINPDYLKNDLWMRGFYSGRESISEQEENPNKSISQLAEEYWIDDRESLIQSELSKLEKGDDLKEL